MSEDSRAIAFQRGILCERGDLRLGVNSILTLDALVGLLHQEKLPEKGAGPKGKVRGKDEDFRKRLGQVGRISDRPGYSGCEARNVNPSYAGAARGSSSSRPGRRRCGRRNDEGGRRLARRARRVRGATRS